MSLTIDEGSSTPEWVDFSQLAGEITLSQFLNNRGSFSCSFCPKRFDFKGTLDLHVRTLHSHEKPYVCSYCPERFFLKLNMADHEQTHTITEEEPSAIIDKPAETMENSTKEKISETGRPEHLQQFGHQENSKQSHSVDAESLTRANDVGNKPKLIIPVQNSAGEKLNVTCSYCSKQLSTKQALVHHQRVIHRIFSKK